MVHKHAHLYTGDRVWQRVKRYIKHVDKDRPPRPIVKQRVPSIKALQKQRRQPPKGAQLAIPDLLARFHNKLPGYHAMNDYAQHSRGGKLPMKNLVVVPPKKVVVRRASKSARRLGIGKGRRRRK